jgi:RNA polymerase sigma-70 factor, ECF subfamily
MMELRELILAIQQHKDAEAFTELYNRYHRQLYGVTYHICGRRELAEEAVQEAMLRIWRKADSIDVDNNPHKWILRVAVRTTINILQREKKRTAMTEPAHEPQSAPASSPAAQVEEGELLAAISERIQSLPQEEKLPVILYYVGGFTQEEIGDTLAVPRRTIAKRLQDGLESLRSDLMRAGFTAAVPLLSTDGMQAAVLNGAAPSETLRLSVLESVKAPLHSKKLAAVTKPGSIVSPALILSAVIAATAVIVLATQASAPTANVNSSAVAPASPAPSYRRKWSFEDGAIADLPLAAGTWTWKKQRDGKGAMDVPQAPAIVAVLPDRMPQKPFRVDLETFVANRKGHASLQVHWCSDTTFIPYKLFRGHMVGMPQGRVNATLYCVGKNIAYVADNKLAAVSVYDERPFASVCILIQNTALRSVTVTELTPEELPQCVRDIEKIIPTLIAEPAVNAGVRFRDAETEGGSK